VTTRQVSRLTQVCLQTAQNRSNPPKNEDSVNVNQITIAPPTNFQYRLEGYNKIIFDWRRAALWESTSRISRFSAEKRSRRPIDRL